MFPSQKCRKARQSGLQSPGFNEAGMFPSQKCEMVGLSAARYLRFNEAGMFPSQKWFYPYCV